MSVRSATLIACGVLAACGGAGGEPTAPPRATDGAASTAFAVAADDVTPQGAGGARARVVLSEATTGNADASMTIVEQEPDVTVTLPGSAESATLVYTIEGSARAYGHGDEEGAPVAAGDAIFAPPGVRLAFYAEEPSKLMVVFAPAGPEEAFEGGPDVSVDLERARPQGTVTVVPAQKAPRFSLAGGAGEVIIYVDEAVVGERAASLGLLTAGPGMTVPAHTHDDASEYLYLLRGRGTMRAADETFEVRAGMGVQVPRGVEHAFDVEGDEPVRAVQVYAPAGPEQRFKRQ